MKKLFQVSLLFVIFQAHCLYSSIEFQYLDTIIQSNDALEQYLLSGGDVNATVYGDTLLRILAGSGNSRAVELLLAAGAEVDQVDISGQSALHAAVYSGSLLKVQALMRGGINEHLQNREGKTAYDCLLDRLRIHKNHSIQGPRLQSIKDYFDSLYLPVAQVAIDDIPLATARYTESNED